MFARTSSLALWLATILLVATPFVLAFDYGGTLDWSQYLATVAVSWAIGLTLLAVSIGSIESISLRHFILPGLILLWAAYGLFQSIPLPSGLVQWLSPATYAAATQWAAPLTQAAPDYMPISMAAADSRHIAALLAVTAAVLWAATVAFSCRLRAGWLLIAISFGASAIAVIAIYQSVSGTTDFWWIVPDFKGKPFGPFLNRNNAALMFNIGIAASLGLIAWRVNALTPLSIDDPRFRFDDLYSIIGDRNTQIGMATLLASGAGVLFCGSRAGVLTLAIAVCISLGWIKSRRGRVWQVSVVLGMAVAAGLLLVPRSAPVESIDRIAESAAVPDFQDARLSHWPDGWRAAVAHLPAGSGLASYAYAYLPFIQTSQPSWFHHADNLWLELVVEQGLVGLAFLVAIVFLLVRALRMLKYSSDTLDQGLIIAGWYLLTAIAVSQLFDFGMINLPNLWTATLFLGAIYARGSVVGPAAVDRKKRRDEAGVEGLRSNGLAHTTPRGTTLLLTGRRFGRGRVKQASTGTSRPGAGDLRSRVLQVAVGATFCLATAAAHIPIRGAAAAESALSVVRVELANETTDPDRLDQLIRLLAAEYETSADDRLAILLCELNFQRGRVADVQAANPKSQEAAIRLYRSTSKINRRLRKEPSIPVLANDYYRQAAQYARLSLERLPLGIESRMWSIYLDFVDPGESTTVEAVNQLAAIYRNDPDRLISLGQTAAESRLDQAAVELWRRALLLRPDRVFEIANIVSRMPSYRLSAIVPETHGNYAIALPLLLRDPGQNREAITGSLQIIRLDQAQSSDELSRLNQITAQAAIVAGRPDLATERLRAAVSFSPGDAKLRTQWIRHLRQYESPEEAAREEGAAKLIFAGDSRFAP